MTAPSVTYRGEMKLFYLCNFNIRFKKILYIFAVRIKGEKNIKKYRTNEFNVSNPSHLPDVNIITEMLEPTVLGTIITPGNFLHIFYFHSNVL